MFGRNKKKKVQKKRQKQSMEDISSGKVRIKVFMNFGGNVPFLKDVFLAEEVRDGYGGLTFTNEGKEFREDINFEMDDVFKELQVVLKLEEKPQEKQVEVLDKKIEKQKKILSYLSKHTKLNAVINFIDENVKLQNYMLLKNHIKKNCNGRGSFFRVEDGVRTYEFHKNADGFFYPTWFSYDEYSYYPDYVRKKKIYVSEAKIFEEEIGARFRRRLENITKITVWVVAVILVIACMYLGAHLLNKNEQADLRIMGSAYQCAEYTSKINKNIADLLNNEALLPFLEQKNLSVNNATEKVGIIPLNPIKALERE